MSGTISQKRIGDGGCVIGGAGGTSAAGAVRITEKDNKKTIDVTKGSDIVLELPSNPTTGFDWKIVQNDRTFGRPSKEEFIPRSRQSIGSGGTARMTWSGNNPLLREGGKHTVKLVYQRAHDSLGTRPATFEFTVRITAAKTTAITAKDNGKTIRVPTGKDVVVELPENPSTGYRWLVSSTDRSFGQPTRTYLGGGDGAVGSGGTVRFTWKTDNNPFIHKGETHGVQMVLQRPWAETSPPAERFGFKVKLT